MYDLRLRPAAAPIAQSSGFTTKSNYYFQLKTAEVNIERAPIALNWF